MKGKYNVFAITFVVVFQQCIGFIWYSPMVLGKQWLAEVGKTTEELKAAGVTPYIVSIIVAYILCIILSRLIYETKATTASQGVNLAILLWLGFSVSTGITHYLFSGHGLNLFMIDAGHNLVGMILAGFVLSIWR